jgi:DNA-binding NarL/FixJ family response regulator
MTAGTIRVVVCEDHQVVADGLAAVLGLQPGIEVVDVVHSVADVVDSAREHSPDVVLMDYGLPDGNGAEATRAVKQARPEAKVVMLTSFADEETLVAAIEAGCSGFVPKHKGSSELTVAVRLAAEGEAVVSPDMLALLLPRLTHTHRGLGSDLTPREREVLQLLSDGESKDRIGARLFLSPNTVRNHIQSILSKLGAHSRLEAVAIAVREGLIRRT